MSNAAGTNAGWRQKVRRELFEYWVTALYLGLFFGAFVGYRRLLMAEYHIRYLHYGFAAIEALILAKVILIGDLIGLGRLRRRRALIVPVLFRAARFTLWVALFTLLEHELKGLVEGAGLMGGVEHLLHEGKYELLASSLVVFFAFIPFFAFKELNRVMGEGSLWRLFFQPDEPRSEPKPEPGP